LKIGDREFQTKGHTYVMGILNVTPDSFSDGGRWNDRDRALKHVEEMIAEGADVIDIGGESTRPGYTLLPDEEEIARVVPMIEAVKERFDIPVSLDTYKSAVALAGISAGADLINDIWGLKYDDKMAGVIAKSGLPCCLMHNRKNTDYTDFMQDVAADLADTIHLAQRAGIEDDRIILDPGVGFAKSYEQNLEVINCLEELRVFNYPILLGCSRKSVIGITLDLPADQRIEGTIVTTVIGVLKGCMFVRVHDVKENVRAIRMTEAICNQNC
jgi:dihydropteroate synthase